MKLSDVKDYDLEINEGINEPLFFHERTTHTKTGKNMHEGMRSSFFIKAQNIKAHVSLNFN